MALVEVYNTTTNPVVYGDGQVLGGLERMTVEESLVADALKRGVVRIARPRPVLVSPVEDSAPPPVVDSEPAQTDVPLKQPSKPSGTTVKKSSVDEGLSVEKPATIRKTRRPRKSPVKE